MIVVGIGLVDIAGFRRLYAVKRSDFTFAAITTAGVLVFGMLIGVGIAVLASLLDVARRAMHPNSSVLGRVPGSDRYSDVDEHPGSETTPGLVVCRFDAPLFFANVDGLIERIDGLLVDVDPPPTAVLISAEAITDIDVTAIDAFTAYVTELHGRGITVAVARLKTDVLAQLERADAVAAFADRYFLETDDGVDAFRDGELGGQPDGIE